MAADINFSLFVSSCLIVINASWISIFIISRSYRLIPRTEIQFKPFKMHQRRVLRDNDWYGWLDWIRNSFREGTIKQHWKEIELGRWFGPRSRNFINNEVIGQQQSKQSSFEEIYRILRNNGRIIISDIVTEVSDNTRDSRSHEFIKLIDSFGTSRKKKGLSATISARIKELICQAEIFI